MWLLAEISGGSLFFMAVVALTAGLLLVRTQRQLSNVKKASKPHSHAPANPAASRPSATAQRVDTRTGSPHKEVERWEVRMHDLARELSATLDSKMSALQHLVRDAEAQIARLEGLIEHARVSRSEPAHGDAVTPHSKLSHSKLSDSALSHGPTQAAGLASVTVGQRTPLRPPPAVQRAAPDRRYEQIYKLADAGHDMQAISKHVGSPVGEVELILSLRQKP